MEMCPLSPLSSCDAVSLLIGEKLWKREIESGWDYLRNMAGITPAFGLCDNRQDGQDKLNHVIELQTLRALINWYLQKWFGDKSIVMTTYYKCLCSHLSFLSMFLSPSSPKLVSYFAWISDCPGWGVLCFWKLWNSWAETVERVS